MGVRDRFIDASKKFRQKDPSSAPSDEDAERESIQDDSGIIQPPIGWPNLPEAALHGLAGEVVRTISPHTEADPVAILSQFIVFFGNCVGPSPHFRIGGDEHPGKLFAALVGESSFARKGTSEGQVRRIFERVDVDWAKKRIVHGLASGEGLIRALQPEGTSADPRMIAIEPEMANVLKAMQRDGSTLSGVLRQAWDSGDLRVMTRKDPLAATGTHLSIVTHITRTELVGSMDSGQATNGFANRFLWLLVRRVRVLPDADPVPSAILEGLSERTTTAVEFARRVAEMKRDPEASTLWRTVYPGLTSPKLGVAGAVTSRAHVQVIRLALLYALLDMSPTVRAEHIQAAMGFWDYAAHSAKVIFGGRLGNPTANRLWTELQDCESGEMSREDAFDVLGRNCSAALLDVAVILLKDMGLIQIDRRPQPPGQRGRPREVYVKR